MEVYQLMLFTKINKIIKRCGYKRIIMDFLGQQSS